MSGPFGDEGGFGIANLPYGAFSVGEGPPRIGVAIGEHVLDLAPALGDEVFAAPVLNPFLALGREAWAEARNRITELLTDAHKDLTPYLIPRQEVRMSLPIEVADYADFYSSEHHARNVGAMFRPGGDPLPANWKHLPAGYHGRAGTIVVSGTPVVRPCGQYRSAETVTFGPEPRLDIEAEVGFVVGVPSEPGVPVAVMDFREHVFGVVLLNDWSARAIQAWEYTPLGPFLGKSFATSISPWVVPLEALAAAWVPAPSQDPVPLDYLTDHQGTLDLRLEIEWNTTVVSRPPFRQMYWTPAQQLAHLTGNGAALRTGDLFASGTVSGPERDQRGSLLELSWNGTEPVDLGDEQTHTFLADGDTVKIRGRAPGPDGAWIDLGSVDGTIVGVDNYLSEAITSASSAAAGSGAPSRTSR
jgi:fumarylacetoacetase